MFAITRKSILQLGLLASLVLGSWAIYVATSAASTPGSGPTRICVTSASAALPSDRAAIQASGVVGRLEASHNRYSAKLQADPARRDRVVAFQRPVVVAGCPHGYQPPAANRDLPVRGYVDAPSDYLIKVFVVPDDDTAALDGHPFRVQPYEMVCESAHVCAEVTTALYVSSSLIGDPDGLFAAIEFATGLAEPERPPSEGPREKKPPVGQ
jgi:hypothetical protein